MPKSVDVIFTPLITMLVCVIPYIFFIMPLFGYASAASSGCSAGGVPVGEHPGPRRFGLHRRGALPAAGGGGHASRPCRPVQRPAAGTRLRHALPGARHGRRGSGRCRARALWKKAKRVGNKDLCSAIAGALPAGLLGVGEPLIYGVTLPLGKPFLTAGLGAGFRRRVYCPPSLASPRGGLRVCSAFVMTAGQGGPDGASSFLSDRAWSSVYRRLSHHGRLLRERRLPSEAEISPEERRPDSARGGLCPCQP